MLNLIFLGDVVGAPGCEFVRSHLPALKKLYGAQAVIANGENSAPGNGILPQSMQSLFDSGVDLITTGNHVWRRREIYDALDRRPDILRPANYPDCRYGRGVGEIDLGRVRIAVLNLIGLTFMDPLDNPFAVADRLLERIDTPLIFVDFHAEATSEKAALAYHLDGRVSAVIGTHTHVQTADEQILPGGTAFLSDAGMCGPIRSVLGVSPALAIERFRYQLPVRFDTAPGPCKMEGVALSLDEKTGHALSIERFCVK